MAQQDSITPSKAPEEEQPCSACSFTKTRQSRCRYESNIKLFYTVSDRGVWTLGQNYIVKERGMKPPTFEVRNIRFLQENTSIPVPNVILEDYYDDDRTLVVFDRIPGVTLEKAWETMSTADKERVAQQTASCLSQLRSLQSPRMESLGGQPLYDPSLFRDGYGTPHGPFASDDELWTDILPSLKDLPEKARLRLRQRMPSAEPYTFTHGDLTHINIMVKDGHLTGILDWERSGYYPVWWEFTNGSIGLSQTDFEWKTLLGKYLDPYQEGREFWMDIYVLLLHPESDRAKRVMKELMSD